MVPLFSICIMCTIIASHHSISGCNVLNFLNFKIFMLYLLLRPTRSKQLSTVAILGFQFTLYHVLYNNPSYSRILICSCLWSIRGRTHNWRHHYRVFPSAVLKWRKVLRIRIIFYVTGQKIRTKKSCQGIHQVRGARKRKIKPFLLEKWYRNNFLAASVGSRARLSHAQTSRSTVLQLKCVSDTISSWFENHQPQKTKMFSVI